MSKKALVAYFSASGVTAKLAGRLAKAVGADQFEIIPEQIYTDADLDWRDSRSRSSVEMNDRSARPAIASKMENIAQYEVIFVGFPVWWYREPSVIDSFLEAYDFSGKKIIPFATSGGSDIGEEVQKRIAEITGTEVLKGKRFAANVNNAQLKEWLNSFR